MFSEAGVIGRSGEWYGCARSKHIATMENACEDAPFVELHNGDMATFDAYPRMKPTQAQFETLMDWCTAMGKCFEDVVTGYWRRPWGRT